jgi:hypothetical protein
MWAYKFAAPNNADMQVRFLSKSGHDSPYSHRECMSDLLYSGDLARDLHSCSGIAVMKRVIEIQ